MKPNIEAMREAISELEPNASNVEADHMINVMTRMWESRKLGVDHGHFVGYMSDRRYDYGFAHADGFNRKHFAVYMYYCCICL